MKYAFAAITLLLSSNGLANECSPFNFPTKFEVVNYEFIENDGDVSSFPAKKGVLILMSAKEASLIRFFENDPAKTHKLKVSNFCKTDKTISWSELIDTMDYPLERDCHIKGKIVECTTLFSEQSDYERFGAVENFTLIAIE